MLPIHTIEGSEQLLAFLRSNHQEVEKVFSEKSAVLFRGFEIYSLSEFQEASDIICKELFDYKYGSTPRTKLGGKVYTSTEYPPELPIAQHNENSYTNKWPSKILFYCAVAPGVGGQTPIANSHEVYKLIPKDIRDRFIKKGVMYTRNYGSGMDLTWQQAFQTEDKGTVEEFCQSNGINYEWLGQGKLRTNQVCQAILEHPKSKVPVWFNQAHLFHQSANDPLLQDFFKAMDPIELPRNAFYGDGTHFAEEDLNKIREAYKQAEQKFAWKKGDLMLLDNVLYSHGREPFKGERRVLVSMGE